MKRIAASMVVVLAVVGCAVRHGAPTVIGSWSGTVYPAEHRATLTFRDDMTVTVGLEDETGFSTYSSISG